jgi:hypothetical protein
MNLSPLQNSNPLHKKITSFDQNRTLQRIKLRKSLA